MSNLFLKLESHQKLQLPFVVFCKPNSDKIIGLFQNDAHEYFIENFEEKGFVFAPFNGSKIPYIPVDASQVYVENATFLDFYLDDKILFSDDENSKSDFEELIQKGINAIEKGTFHKVVLSRKETFAISNFDYETTFKRLIANYPTAFKYCFFHPKIGLWVGASPEQFLKVNNQVIQTVALAGTQVFEGDENVNWGTKEQEEQQFVTNFIESSLKKHVTEVSVSKPFTVKAGTIMHIKSTISAKLLEHQNLRQIIETLHPTPAVCGLPKTEAMDFILQNEGYNREYYSGFLGELNIDLITFKTEESDLFVNLRCMKIDDSIVQLYMGCGITKDSIPNKEYIETVNKSMTMRQIL